MATMLEADAPPKLPPLFRRPAVVRLLLIALFAEIGYAVLNISTMPVYLRDDRQFGPLAISLVLASFLLSEAIFKGPLGHFADRYGCKRFMVLGPTITLCTALASFLIPHGIGNLEVMLFILLRVGDGVAASMLWPAAFAMMGNSVEDHERQQAMSLLNMVYLLGIALALPIGGIAEDVTGYRAAGLVLAAVIFAATALGTYRFLPNDHVKVSEQPVEQGTEEGFRVLEFLRSFRQIPGYLALAIVTFIGVGLPMPIIKIFALEELNLSASGFGALVFPGAIAMAAFSVPMSRYGERVGRAKAVHVGMGLCVVGLAFISMGEWFPVMRAPWALALGAIPVGIGFLLTIPAWLTSVSDIDPKKRAANIGAVMTAQGIGAIIGMPFGGLLYQKVSHYAPFIGCAVCVALGWAISFKLLKDPK
jgi:MFS transporter, DHA1 family, multidrug resistance protein